MRGDDVLLIKRGSPPLEGRWSLPGGRIEWGERAIDAALRELKEETSCTAEIVGLIDVVDAILTRAGVESAAAVEAPWGHYLLVDYAARWIEGEPIAGDDAADARFFAPAELNGLGLWAETLRVITAARALLAG
jgi:8-oxo-dGTP diphosphatase